MRHLSDEDLDHLELWWSNRIQQRLNEMEQKIMAEIDDATARMVASAERVLAKITDLEAQLANQGNPANAATLNAEADKLDAAVPPA